MDAPLDEIRQGSLVLEEKSGLPSALKPHYSLLTSTEGSIVDTDSVGWWDVRQTCVCNMWLCD
jgi:hypothetical protein